MTSGLVTDSISGVLQEVNEAVIFHRPSSPYQALKLLPANATPAQQDSVVQLYCQPVKVCHSCRPDTLSLPGLEGTHFGLENVPKYTDGFFSDNEYLHTELKVTFSGIAGNPIPYRLRDDIFITSTLLISFFVVMFIIARSLHVLFVQFKNFFYFHKRNEMIILNRDSEIKTQTYVILLSSFLMAIMFLHYSSSALPNVFNRTSPYKLLVLNSCVCLMYFFVKVIMYQTTNWTFFSHQSIQQWNNMYNLLALLKVVGYFMLTLVIVFFDLQNSVSIWMFFIIYSAFILLLAYKVRQIFFCYNFALMHLFLYLCTLEIIPLLFLGWILIEANLFTLVFV